jgi:hypothetical protein
MLYRLRSPLNQICLFKFNNADMLIVKTINFGAKVAGFTETVWEFV